MAPGRKMNDAGAMWLRNSLKLVSAGGRLGWLASVVAISGNALAQSPDTSAIRSAFEGPDGVPLRGVQVEVVGQDGVVVRHGVSDAAGLLNLDGLPLRGAIRLRARLPGFALLQTRELTLEPGTTAKLALRMQVAAGTAEVQVTGTAGEVRADSPQLGDRLSREQVETTPLLNRRMTYLPLLNAANKPAINQGDVFMNQDLFTTNGTGRRQAWFEVDGANSVDAWGRQTIFTNVPLDAIAELTVLESGFAADYGFGEGGVVNVVTRSGGEHVHGDVLMLGRPADGEASLAGFTASNAGSGNDVTSDTLLQGSASVSGPLQRDGRSSFATAAEYSSEDRASPVIAPLDRGSFMGHYRDWMGFLRLDHTFSEQNRGFIRADSDAFVDTNPNGIVGGNTLPTVARTFHRRTFEVEGGDTAVLSASLVNEARLQLQIASPITQFSPVIDATQVVVPISDGGTYTAGTSQSALLLNRQYEASDTVSKSWGRNTLRAGLQAMYAHSGGNSKEFGGPIYDGELLYNTCTGTAAYCESSAYLSDLANVQSYTQSYGNASYTVNDVLAAAFLQDDMQIAPNVLLNLGLRYELQRFTDARADVAPRVGFAWNVNGRGSTTVRGGFGIYDAQVVDNEEADYALTGPTGVFNYTAAPGQAGFPRSVHAVPLPAFPTGAVAPLRSLYLRPGRAAAYTPYLPVKELVGYPDALLNPYNEQWTLGLEQSQRRGWLLRLDYLGSHTLRIVRPLDVDAPSSFVRTAPNEVRSAAVANCTRPYWKAWFAERGETCGASGNPNGQPPYSVVQSDVNDGAAYYESGEVNLSYHGGSGSSLLVSYVLAHALDTVDPDVPSQNPNDALHTGEAELGNAIFDQRQRLVVSGLYEGPRGVQMGGVVTLAGGLPYNIVTGVNNSGDTGATTDRPVIGGVVVGRNTGRGQGTYDVSPVLAKRVQVVPERLDMELRAEAFNVLNHRNIVGYSGTWGNGPLPGNGFGQPLTGVTNQLPARELQFSMRVEF